MSQFDMSRGVLDHLREVADIVTVVGDQLTLRKAGRNFVGLCPFHAEKTGSFNVSREKGTYYCFGCKRGGDVIDFVMEMDRVTFPEAVERLADRFGIALPEATPGAARRRSENDQLGEALEAAQAYFAARLSDDRPRAFLERRGVSLEVAREFQLGFAPGEWRGLYDALRSRHPERVLIAAGLIVQGDGGKVWDRFRDRVMIPIRSPRGRIIAFGGRALGDDPAKYLNSPETPLFSKGQTLFALDRASRAFASSSRAIVVEGYFDCIALHTVGFTETVATLGTSLTEHHARELQRKVPLVVLCFDGDTAGRHAARQALRTLLAAEVRVAVALLPDGVDPDDLARHEGRFGVERLLHDALPEADFLVAELGETREERRDRLRDALELVDASPDPVRRWALREALARAAGVPLEQLGATSMPRFTNQDSSGSDLPPTGEMALLRGLLIDLPPARRVTLLAQVPIEAITHPLTRRILLDLRIRAAEGRTLEISALAPDIDDRDVRRLLAALEHEAFETDEERLVFVVRGLWERQKNQKLADLRREMARAEQQNDQEELARLAAEWHVLRRMTNPS